MATKAKPRRLFTEPIVDGLDLPIEILTHATAIIGASGSGKSYTMRRLAEVASTVGCAGAILDRLGTFYALRFAEDGRSAGVPIPVFGGAHGDAPILSTSGPAVAKMLLEHNAFAIIDLSDFDDDELAQFVRHFVRTVRFGLKTRKQPFSLWIDEAPEIVPETPERSSGKERERLLARNEVRRYCLTSRGNGGGYVVASQSYALVDKKILGRVDVLAIGRMSLPNEVKPIVDWVSTHDPAHAVQIRQTLPTLDDGEAWWVSPQYLRVTGHYRTHKTWTFDSTKQPEIGEKIEIRGKGATIDMAAFTAGLKDAIAAAEAEDPDVLRGRIASLERTIAELEREHANPAPQEPVEPPAPVEVPVIRPEQLEALQGTLERVDGAIKTAMGLAPELNVAAHVLKDAIAGARRLPAPGTKVASTSLKIKAPPTSKTTFDGTPAIVTKTAHPGVYDVTAVPALGKAERALLVALAQTGPCDKSQLGVFAGYSSRSSHFDNTLGKLRAAGYISRGTPIAITSEGRAALGHYDPLPTGEALRAYWLGRLKKADKAILSALINVYPRTLQKHELGARSGYSPTSSHFDNTLGKLRTLKLIHGSGALAASDALFTTKERRGA